MHSIYDRCFCRAAAVPICAVACPQIGETTPVSNCWKLCSAEYLPCCSWFAGCGHCFYPGIVCRMVFGEDCWCADENINLFPCKSEPDNPVMWPSRTCWRVGSQLEPRRTSVPPLHRQTKTSHAAELGQNWKHRGYEKLTHVETYVEDRANASASFHPQVSRGQAHKIGNISVCDVDALWLSCCSYFLVRSVL